MSNAETCVCCGAVIPEGSQACPKCLLYAGPPIARFNEGQLVKCNLGKRIIYNHIVDYYYNEELQLHMYRLNERMAMPIYREDWLAEVSDTEVDELNRKLMAGKVKPRSIGGWEEVIEDA